MNATPSPSKCDDVVTIPQFSATCWFNSLLMAMFYSERTRSFFKKHLSTIKDKSKEKVVNVLEDILDRRYITNKVNKKRFYNELSPDNLLKFLHNEDHKTFYYNYLKHGDGHNAESYLNKFTEYLECDKNILYTYFEDTNDGLKGLYQSSYNFPFKTLRISDKFVHLPLKKGVNYSTILDDPKRLYELYKSHVKSLESINKSKNTIPDIIITSLPRPLTKSINTMKSLYDKVGFDFKYDMYKTGQISNEKLGEKIEYKGYTYIVDALLLTNFDTTKCNDLHQIAGVTCDGERYMYNGWINRTSDPAKKGHDGGFDNPCTLMKFDWFNNSNDFCLNTKKCKLDKKKDKDILCFNSKKGQMTYIYVKQEKLYIDKKGVMHSKIKSSKETTPQTSPQISSKSPFMKKSPSQNLPKQSSPLETLSKYDKLCVDKRGVIHKCKNDSLKNKITMEECNKQYKLSELKDIARKLKEKGVKIAITQKKMNLCKDLLNHLPNKM